MFTMYCFLLFISGDLVLKYDKYINQFTNLDKFPFIYNLIRAAYKKGIYSPQSAFIGAHECCAVIDLSDAIENQIS
jgi:hypothetical protein